MSILSPTNLAAESPEKPTPTEEDRLRARLEAVRAERAAKKVSRNREGAVDRLTQQIADEEALLKAEDEHGAVATFETADGIVIVRCPEPVRYKKYQGIVGRLAQKNTDSSNAQLVDEAHSLCLQCLVHPAKPRFEQLAEKFPGMPMQLANKISELAAGRTSEVQGE